MRALAPIIGLVAVTVLAGGCAGSAEPRARSAAGPVAPPAAASAVADLSDGVPTVTSDADIALPLDAYALSPDEVVYTGRAVSMLTRRCMAEQGLAWAGTVSPPPRRFRHENRYGRLGEREAARYGYHRSGSAPASRDGAAGGGAGPVPGPKEQAALGQVEYRREGMRGTGCLGEATSKVQGTSPAGDPIVHQTVANGAGSLRVAERGERVRHAYRRWSRCMRGHGYDYPQPDAASGDKRWETARPTAAEIAVALADTRCKRSVNLAGAWLAAEIEIQRDYIAEHRELLTGLRAAKRRAMDITTRVLATS